MAPLTDKLGDKEDKRDKSGKGMKGDRYDEKDVFDHQDNAATKRRMLRKQRKNDPKIDVEAILNEGRKLDFDQKDDIELFKNKHNEILDGWKSDDHPNERSGNILHALAKRQDWPLEKLKAFLNWLLRDYYRLLEKTDSSESSPIDLALKEETDSADEFVIVVLQVPRLRNLGEILTLTNAKSETPLHVAIRLNYIDPEIIINKCRKSQEVFVKGDRNGNTPLHLAMMVESDEEHQRELEQSLKKHILINKKDPFTESPEITPGTSRSATINRLRLAESGRTEQNITNGDTESGVESLGFLLRMVKLLITARPEALKIRNKYGRTPYQEREYQLYTSKMVKNVLEGVKSKDDKILDSALQAAAFRSIFVEDQIASYIRCYCISESTFSREEIMTCLYQPGKERHIEFDLAGLPNPTIAPAYLDRLANHLKFESILRYVALPRLTIESSKRQGRSKSHATPARKGLTDLKVIFDWLRSKDVQKIVKVIVVDDGIPSHPDSIIEEALREFDVEEWDWKKIDLCSEVICNSSKSVREISLYSSGNNAVLMGWASHEGLVNRTKFPKLKTVNLFIREGQEDEGRLKKNLATFQKALESRTDNDLPIVVKPVMDNMPISYASEIRIMIQSEDPWISCMKNFATFLRNVDSSEKSNCAVKIAIIDDGADASLEALAGRIEGGKSFSPYPNSTDLMNAYFAPSGKHGTRMATLVSQICPDPRLYVARLDEHMQTDGDGRRQITAKSAAEAVQWAVDCGVDIISMSWTIETEDPSTTDMTNLKQAIARAEQEKILMFCSASDQGANSKEGCYPGDWNNCCRIGAADSHGKRLAWVHEQTIDFLLPGKNIPFMHSDGITLSYESGSSIATAAASGLAGLLLFCSRLLGGPDESYFKIKDNMSAAFKTMSWGSDRQFPHVDEYFEQMFKDFLLPDVPEAEKSKRKASKKVQDENWDDVSKRALQELISRIKQKNRVK